MFTQVPFFFFFTWPECGGEASKTVPSDGIQSQAKSLPAAPWVYCFSLFQVLTTFSFLLNFI